jgi:hypothetical protein
MKTYSNPLMINEEGPPILKPLGGSESDTFNLHITNAALSTCWVHSAASDERKKAIQTANIIAMKGFEPTDEIEGMIAAQAVAMHNMTIECSKRAMIDEQPSEIAAGLRKAAANSSRTFVALLDALDRKRGKGGQQKVTVEHVHVHAGGQAIVGHVESGGGGGVGTKRRDEPQAPDRVAHDAGGVVMPPVRCADADREPMQRAGDAQRPLSDARRRKHRPAND